MLLKTEKLDKRFNRSYALCGLDFSLEQGEIHGLIGENGAGKSTFIKILGGVYRKDRGTVYWNGTPADCSTPEKSRELGIRIVYQDSVLIPAFSALENIWLGYAYPTKVGKIRWKVMEEQVRARAGELGIPLDLKTPVTDLSPSQKKLLEILRAMMDRNIRLLILDEPTASLSDKESKQLFHIIRGLKAQGTAILYVSHRLEEILELADRITVLQGGRLVRTVNTGEVGREQLVSMMSGEETPDISAGLGSDTVGENVGKNTGENTVENAGNDVYGGPAGMEIQNLYSRDGIVKGASLKARPGRITGLYGLCGSGRTEFLECVYGYRKIKSGRILVGGAEIKTPTPPKALAAGMALISEDRRGKALIPSFTVRENMLLSSIDRFSRNGRFWGREADRRAEDMIRALNIKCTGTRQRTAELSGGNQQKVVFAKAMLTEPSIWLCDEPTQAVDVATRREIHRLLQSQAAMGKAVIYVSSDLTELLEVAHEVNVMADGRIAGTFENKNLRPEQILACCYGTKREGAAG